MRRNRARKLPRLDFVFLPISGVFSSKIGQLDGPGLMCTVMEGAELVRRNKRELYISCLLFSVSCSLCLFTYFFFHLFFSKEKRVFSFYLFFGGGMLDP